MTLTRECSVLLREGGIDGACGRETLHASLFHSFGWPGATEALDRFTGLARRQRRGIDGFVAPGPCASAPGLNGGMRRARRRVALVDGDVEAGLAKLFFYVDLACGFERQQAAAHPGDLAAAQTVFGNVDGRAGQVRAHNITFCRGSVAVDSIKCFWYSMVRTAELTSSGRWKAASCARDKSVRKIAVHGRQ